MEPYRILLTAGSNARGQLGIGSYDDAHTFTPCRFAGFEPNQLPDRNSIITHIACGANHTVLLLQDTDGSTTLWGTGDGRRGQLGPDYPREESDPAPWTIFHKLSLEPRLAAGASYASRGYVYKDVAAAWETTYVVLSRSGSADVLVSMGSNEFGALGAGESADTAGSEPRVVDFDHVLSDESGRRVLPGNLCIRSLHAGPRHVVAQLVTASTAEDGSSSSQATLVGWGASRHGQFGHRDRTRFISRPIHLPVNIDDDPMIACALGNQHTVILRESGQISAFGSNKQGQIPLPESRRRIFKLGCTWNGTYMQSIDDDKHVLLSMGNNAQGQLGQGYTVESSSTVGTTVRTLVDRTISNFVCGSEHVLAAASSSSLESNSVVGWGWNEHGNMGLGTLQNIAIPTQLWPREDIEAYHKYPQRVIGIWAGCATSWLLVE